MFFGLLHPAGHGNKANRHNITPGGLAVFVHLPLEFLEHGHKSASHFEMISEVASLRSLFENSFLGPERDSYSVELNNFLAECLQSNSDAVTCDKLLTVSHRSLFSLVLSPFLFFPFLSFPLLSSPFLSSRISLAHITVTIRPQKSEGVALQEE